MQCNFLAL